MNATSPGSHAEFALPRHDPPAETGSPVRVGVLAVQGDVAEHLAVLRRCGAEASTVRRPRELDEVDALVLPGGESTAIDRLVRAFDLQGPLRERLRSGMPALGSCAGMILLADRLDAVAAATPDKTATPDASATPQASATPTPTPTATETPTPTPAATETPTPTPTATETATPAPTP